MFGALGGNHEQERRVMSDQDLARRFAFFLADLEYEVQAMEADSSPQKEGTNAYPPIDEIRFSGGSCSVGRTPTTDHVES
jgi:hypothetical protein